MFDSGTSTLYISRFTFQPAFTNWTHSYHSMDCPHGSATIKGLCRAFCICVSYGFTFKCGIYVTETRIDTMDVEVILLAVQREQRGDPKIDVLRRLKKLFNHRLL